MALSWKARRRLALLVLLVALPAYIVAVVTVVGLFNPQNFLVQLAIYIGLGVVWALPLKAVFKGVGQPNPDDSEDHGG